MSSRRKSRRQVEEEESMDEEKIDNHKASQSYSKGKKKARVEEPEEEEEEDEDDDDAGTQTQSKKSEVTGDELRKKVKDLVRLSICHERQRTPLRRDEITKAVLKEASKSFPIVFQDAQDKLNVVFGMELVQLPARDKKAEVGKKASSSAPTKQYVLRSLLPPDKMCQLLDWKEELPQMSLLYVVLALIIMNNNALSEDRLFHHMKALKLYKEKDGRHPTFGNVEKVLAQFVKEHYLVKSKESVNGQDVSEVRWGPRARSEVGAETIVNFIAELYGEEADQIFLRDLRKQAGLNKAPGNQSQSQAD